MKLAIISILCAILLNGCAASPDTLIYIDKSIYVELAEDLDIEYSTSSGVSSAAEFDGEVSPDVSIPAIP